MGKSILRNRIFKVLKVLPSKILTNYKGKKGSFMLEIPACPTLSSDQS